MKSRLVMFLAIALAVAAVGAVASRLAGYTLEPIPRWCTPR